MLLTIEKQEDDHMGIFNFWKKKEEEPVEKPVSEEKNVTQDDLNALAVDNPVIRLMTTMLEEVKKDKEIFKDSWMKEQERSGEHVKTIRELEKQRDEWKEKYLTYYAMKREKLKVARDPIDKEEADKIQDTIEKPIPERILSILNKTNKSMSVKEIAGLLHLSNSRTNDYLVELLDKKMLERKKIGKKLIYELKKEGDEK